VNLIKDNVGYFLFNAHGDVVRHGTVVYKYDAFGNELNTVSSDTNPFRYAGEYFDKETENYYLRARYYNPATGRFGSEDTFKGNPTDPMSLNLYTYCTSNPVRYIDPSGYRRIDSEATYYETIWSDPVKRGAGYARFYVGTKEHKMTKVEFTNLNIVVYTMDGYHFHTSKQSLFEGAYLFAMDPDELLTREDGFFRNKDGIRGTYGLNGLTSMDEAQGWRVFWGFGKAVFNLALDVSAIIVPILKPLSLAGKTLKIASTVNSAVNIAIDLSNKDWANVTTGVVTTSLGLSQEELLGAFADGASVILDVKGFVEAFDALGYKVEFIDG
jgi:RHS repeat-associated protein